MQRQCSWYDLVMYVKSKDIVAFTVDRKHSEQTSEDEMEPHITTDCGNFTLALWELGGGPYNINQKMCPTLPPHPTRFWFVASGQQYAMRVLKRLGFLYTVVFLS
ncbi:hypothetical protein AMECASPLE_015143 [Ameca splendens]|uniref:Uncharacterized protein n=1 Tax=Ameca splendens TaxID=208324 RepID=A0ABV1A952_9TELE